MGSQPFKEYKAVVSNCENTMTCSEETKLCEYICPENYTYDFTSGFCTKPCSSNEIVQGDQCIPCLEGQVVVNNQCTSNPCAEFGDNLMPYNGYCRPAKERLSYISPPLNTSGYTTELDSLTKNSNHVVSVSYAGCINEGGKSNALLKIQSERSPTDYKYSEKGFPFYTYCADGNISGSYNLSLTDKKRGMIPSYVPINEYTSVPAKNICYKYRSFVLDGYSITDLGTVDIPYVDCSECLPGAVKINGVCSCPAGLEMTENGCQDTIKCKTPAEFISGKCNCDGNNVYSYFVGFNGTREYTCEAPTYPKFDESKITKYNNVSLTVSQTSCLGNKFNFEWSGYNDATHHVDIVAVCLDPSFVEKDPLSTTNSNYSFVSNSQKIYAKQSGSGALSITLNGECYNYKFVARSGYSWFGESATISLKYNGCSE